MEREPDENEKIDEIEKAYQDLMNKYLRTLSSKTLGLWTPMLKAILIFLPKIIRWRIRKHLIFVRVNFLLLITQSRKYIPRETIERFEKYNEDVDKIIVQVGMSGLSALFWSILPVIPFLIELIRTSKPQEYYFFSWSLDWFWSWFWAIYIVLYIGYAVHFLGYRKAIRMFVSEERTLSTLIRDYVAPSHNN